MNYRKSDITRHPIEDIMHTMKLMVIVAALGPLANPASAADLAPRLSTKAPAMIDPVYNWTGFYAGLNAGGDWAHVDPDYVSSSPGGLPDLDEMNFVRGFTNPSMKSAGFIGGAQIGYNHQVQNVVFGVEADMNYTGLRQTRLSGPFGGPACATPVCTVTQSYNADWLATFRGRLGLASGAWLLYATGGLALADVSYSDVFVFPTSTNAASSRTVRAGWTAGLGAEWAFAPNWSVKAEYLYADLGTSSYTLTNVTFPAATFLVDHRLTENIARVGINYQFSRPLVARY
jgi:outer membrane immunogenic protein